MLFNCAECGGPVIYSPGKDRTREVMLGIFFKIPDQIELMTCQKCGETFFDKKDIDLIQNLYVNTEHNSIKKRIMAGENITNDLINIGREARISRSIKKYLDTDTHVNLLTDMY